jgi:hypothetical protein
MGQQDDFAVGQLKGITMPGLILVDLSETGHRISEVAGQDDASFASHLVLEGKLRPWKQTNRYVGLVHGSKTARHCLVEAGRYKLVADLRRPGCDKF